MAEPGTTVGAGICPECGRDRAWREPHKPGCSYRQERRARQMEVRQANRDATTRRVYVLPSVVVAKIIDYQVEHSLPSEVAAVRELLDRALIVKGY